MNVPKRSGAGGGGGSGGGGGGGPLKPKGKIRRKGQSGTKSPPKHTGGAAAAANDIEQELDELENTVSVRVRERGPDSPPESTVGRPRSRLGALLRDPSPANIKENIKESIKRPLSGLFGSGFRPGSRSGSRDRSKAHEGMNGSSRGAEGGDANGNADNNTLAEFSLEDEPVKKEKASKKFGFLDGKRPGTAFGRKFSFGRGGNKKEQQQQEEYDSGVEDRRGGGGMIELDSHHVSNDRNSDSPDIPNLDEVEGAAFGTNVAQAPSVAVNRVATYRELDNELMKQAAFATLGDIDLSLLTRFLCPESEVREEEVSWTWDYLYTSICSQLRSEWEEGEEEDDEGQENYTPA